MKAPFIGMREVEGQHVVMLYLPRIRLIIHNQQTASHFLYTTRKFYLLLSEQSKLNQNRIRMIGYRVQTTVIFGYLDCLQWHIRQITFLQCTVPSVDFYRITAECRLLIIPVVFSGIKRIYILLSGTHIQITYRSVRLYCRTIIFIFGKRFLNLFDEIPVLTRLLIKSQNSSFVYGLHETVTAGTGC